MADAKVKIQKKRFVKILAPKLFHGQIMGESPVLDPRSLVGRKIKVNLMTLTNNPKNQNTNVKFEIKTLQGDSVGTEMIGYELSQSYFRRLVRKGRKRADDSYILDTKDNKKMKISPFMITINATNNSILTALRKEAFKFLSKRLKELSCYEVYNELVMNKLQMQLKQQLNKVYPLKSLEIKVANLTSGSEAPSSEEFGDEPKKEQNEANQEIKKESTEARPQEPKKEKKTKNKKEEQPVEEPKEEIKEETKQEEQN